MHCAESCLVELIGEMKYSPLISFNSFGSDWSAKVSTAKKDHHLLTKYMEMHAGGKMSKSCVIEEGIIPEMIKAAATPQW